VNACWSDERRLGLQLSGVGVWCSLPSDGTAAVGGGDLELATALCILQTVEHGDAPLFACGALGWVSMRRSILCHPSRCVSVSPEGAAFSASWRCVALGRTWCPRCTTRVVGRPNLLPRRSSIDNPSLTYDAVPGCFPQEQRKLEKKKKVPRVERPRRKWQCRPWVSRPRHDLPRQRGHPHKHTAPLATGMGAGDKEAHERSPHFL